ncbi:hypothetical protein Scep_024763 [Stephania cephalantha]|uniref:Uncharacterized protein n=1 Tax=Stephania cephalantha TaxID=152367 RepID=A0AAP0F4F7_9MAGN
MSLLALTSSILLFFLFSLVTPSLSRIDTSPPPPPVLDVQGKPVQLGVPYHVLTTFRPQSGLGLGPNRNYSRCPLSVVQAPLLSDGIPVYFHYIYPTIPKERLLRTSRPHQIMFNITGACGIGLWQRGALDKSVGKYFITAGVRPGSTVSSDFRVGSVGVGRNSYKLYSCYLPCTTCTKSVCKDIGVHKDKDGFGRLAMSDDPAHTVVIKENSNPRSIDPRDKSITPLEGCEEVVSLASPSAEDWSLRPSPNLPSPHSFALFIRSVREVAELYGSEKSFVVEAKLRKRSPEPTRATPDPAGG